MFEDTLRTTKNENMELRRRLDLILEQLKNVKAEEMDVKKFNLRLQIKLNMLIDQFKVEAECVELEWIGRENIGRILYGFKEVFKTIVKEKPNYGQLAERLIRLLEVEDKNMKVCEFLSLRNIPRILHIDVKLVDTRSDSNII